MIGYSGRVGCCRFDTFTDIPTALGQKQTCVVQKGMSALPPKADMCGATSHIRFGPKADICSATRYALIVEQVYSRDLRFEEAKNEGT